MRAPLSFNLRRSGVAGFLALGLALSACQNTGPKETGGTVIGAVGGALLGAALVDGDAQWVAIAGGALLGGWLGNQVGSALDENDRAAAARATRTAITQNPDGQATRWSNPATGNSGATRPLSTYQSADSRLCRDYETTVLVNGKTERGVGTACRQPDGTWRVVS